ncbi:MAG: phosphatidate cytidylyltransferase [Sumerlaeia bacterium]
MKNRIAIAIPLLAILALGFFWAPMRFLPVVLIGLLGMISVNELSGMAKQRGSRVLRRIASVSVVILLLLGFFGRYDLVPLFLGVVTPAAFVARMKVGGIEGAWRDVASTLGAAIYVGLPLASLAFLFTAGFEARMWLLMMLTIIFCTDSAAMIFGKKFGKNKIFPTLSPGKTWEGSIGGLSGALLPPLIFMICLPELFHGTGALELAAVAILFSGLAQLGDLSESFLKRDAGVKDSGRALGAHGGALDRIDAALIVAVPFHGYLALFQPGVFLQ